MSSNNDFKLSIISGGEIGGNAEHLKNEHIV